MENSPPPTAITWNAWLIRKSSWMKFSLAKPRARWVATGRFYVFWTMVNIYENWWRSCRLASKFFDVTVLFPSNLAWNFIAWRRKWCRDTITSSGLEWQHRGYADVAGCKRKPLSTEFQWKHCSIGSRPELPDWGSEVLVAEWCWSQLLLQDQQGIEADDGDDDDDDDDGDNVWMIWVR